MNPRIAGHAVVEQLLAYGVEVAFCVPGESYLAVLDGLYDARDRIRLITARQEGGAAMMAAAYGKLTGKAGVCMVTRGPGATNASIGVHIAHQDASPMVLLVGQVPTNQLGRRAFQEVDYRQMFGSLAKDVIQIDTPARVPELIARAFHTATSGEPGPVVVALPEDVLTAVTDAPSVRPAAPVRPNASAAQADDFVGEITRAERPLIVVGGSGWTGAAVHRLQQFAEATRVPVASAVRHQDLVDNRSEVYVGALGLNTTNGLNAYVAEADVIALVGTRPDALTMEGFSLLTVPQPAQRLLHVHPDPDLINRVYRADLAVVAGPAEFVMALAVPPTRPQSDWVTRLRANYLRALETPAKGGTDAVRFMKVLNKRLPADAIISSGAGTYTGWPQRHRQYTSYPSQLGTQSGAMGYGLPAAISAKLAHPERTAVAFAGDGCLLMNGQELATATQYGLDLLVLVINNSRYGAIRDHQENRFPGRVSGTDLVNPDFVEFARSFGAHAARVHSPDDFEVALDESLGCGTTSLIEIVTD